MRKTRTSNFNGSRYPAFNRLLPHLLAITVLITAAAGFGQFARYDQRLERQARSALILAAVEETDYHQEFGRFGNIPELVSGTAETEAILSSSPTFSSCAEINSFSASGTSPVLYGQPVSAAEDAADEAGRLAGFPLTDGALLSATNNSFTQSAPDGWYWKTGAVGKSHFRINLIKEWSTPWTADCLSIDETGTISVCDSASGLGE